MGQSSQSWMWQVSVLILAVHGAAVGQECPGAGDCCHAHPNPGCADAACCETVCAFDTLCCVLEWDGHCVGSARGVCAACPECTRDGDCDEGSACFRDLCVDGACRLTSVAYGDVDGSGGDSPIDLDDIFCVLDGFASPALCPNGDIHPCVRNGDIDLDDILAVLDAFEGANPCGCP